MVARSERVLETTGRPEYPAAAQWSAENLLAIAAGPGMVVVAPPNLSGARGSTALSPTGCAFVEVDAYPKDTTECTAFTSTYMLTRGLYQARNSQAAISRIAVRSISWSPPGCDVQGNALLTSVTDNFQVHTGLSLLHTWFEVSWLNL